jgi:hypothetical protein
MGEVRPEERVHPALRKVKHKNKEDEAGKPDDVQ